MIGEGTPMTAQGLTRMKATARRDGTTLRDTRVQVRDHQLTVDEPLEAGGEDAGPEPAELLAVSLASCTAITMEMYAARKGWEIGPVEVDVEYTPAERGCPTQLPADHAPARRPARGAGRAAAA